MNKGRRAVYFDSNDEMVYQSEISDSTGQNLNDSEGKDRIYTKVLLQATEEEKKRIREVLIKQKKRNIQRFLMDINEKKGTFMHQKLHFKEDFMPVQQINKARSQGSRTSSTQSDEKIGNGQAASSLPELNGQEMDQLRQQHYVKQHNDKMRLIIN